MQTGFHHAFHTHHSKKSSGRTKGLVQLIDKSAYLMGAVTVAVNIPQLIAVWTSPSVAGVSIVSWTGFFMGSAFWLIYGLLHHEKPIIVINGGLIIIQGLIVLGLAVR